MIANNLVVTRLLEEFYFLDTAQPQIAYLHEIAGLNEQFSNALKFSEKEINLMPAEKRSELDENILGCIQAILK